MSIVIDSGQDWSFDQIYQIYDEIETIGVKEMGYNIYPNQVEMITASQMLDAYASIGMPIYYNHWSFGKHFIKNRDLYMHNRQGLAYEIVINSNPCLVYIMEQNTMLMQTLVLAHAGIGHNHFFKNNTLFTDWTQASNIIDYLEFARTFVNNCEEKYGVDRVEQVLDAAHALMNNGVFRFPHKEPLSFKKEMDRKIHQALDEEQNYNDLWKTLPATQKTISSEDKELLTRQKMLHLPEGNLLYFIEAHSPTLKTWQKEILRIVRNVSQYFYPQSQTQLMNEGCLVAGSLIETDRGLLLIEDIVNNHFCPLLKDKNMKNEKIYDHFENSNVNRIKIITDRGYTIHGGENHQILIQGKYIALKELKEGDELQLTPGNDLFSMRQVELPKIEPRRTITTKNIEKMTGITNGYYYGLLNGRYKLKDSNKVAFELYDSLRNNNIIGNFSNNDKVNITTPKYLDEEFAYMIGCFIGDGNIRKGRLTLTNTDDDIIQRYSNCLTQQFGLIVKKNAKPNPINLICYDVTVNSDTFVSWFSHNFNFSYGNTTAKKKIPSLLLQSQKQDIKALLQGLFDTDGCIHVSNKNQPQVDYTSISHDLLKVMHQLLLKFDVISTLNLTNKKGKITICGQETKNFFENIGFYCHRKQIRLQNILQERKRNFNTRNTKIKIVQIDKDVGTTYDFSVTETHSYNTNGFIHHNCAT